MPGDAVVQRCDTITVRCVQLDEREEPGVAQLGDNPARRDLHGDLDLRLIESRRLHAVWVRSPARYASRTRSIPGMEPVRDAYLAGDRTHTTCSPRLSIRPRSHSPC